MQINSNIENMCYYLAMIDFLNLPPICYDSPGVKNMQINDIKSLQKSITRVTFLQRPSPPGGGERWAICLHIDSINERTDAFINYVVHKPDSSDQVREWRSPDVARSAIQPLFETKYPIFITVPLPPSPQPVKQE